MKITAVPEREMADVSFRRAWDMSRAWRPGSESPMSPSSSARGTSAATEFTTMNITRLARAAGDCVEPGGALPGRFRPEDLGDAAAGDAADAEGEVERDRARGDDRHLVERTAGAQAHDGALAELPLDLRDRQLKRLTAVALHLSHAFFSL